MGSTRMGPPGDLILKVKKTLGSNCFIETGTFKGDTAKWASSYFEKVFTIENSQEIYRETTGRLSDIENIEFMFGHTREQLTKIVPTLDLPGIFWIDAHWCGGASYGQQDECPVVEEIQIINNSDCQHCILIDDARLFMGPPPHPHNVNSWPDITELLNVLNEKNGRYIIIRDDVIIAVPEIAKTVVLEYCRAIEAELTPLDIIRRGISQTMKGIRGLVPWR